MSLLHDMAVYLTSAAGLTPGTDLFLGQMPDQPDELVCLYETGGRSPAKAMGNTAGRAHAEYPRLQVVARGAQYGYDSARALANRAFVLLDGLPHRSINGTMYHYGSALQSPFLLNVDEQGRPTIAFNVDIVKDMSTSTA